MKMVTGIDIAKKSMEAAWLDRAGSMQLVSYPNDCSGHQALIEQLGADGFCLMEASGSYYLPLACALHKAGIRLSVINPLIIRRYSQMQLKRTKTDQVDAQLIANYGQQFVEDLPLWEPPKDIFLRLRQLLTTMEQFQKQRNMTRNLVEAMEQVPTLDPLASQLQAQQIQHLNEAIKALEKQLIELSQSNCSQSYQALLSIPGIGPKTAALLIALTHDFSKFETAKQLVAFVGLCPRIFRSGTSVHGKERIVKMGQPLARKYLYMGAFSAMKYNLPCQQLVQTMKQKGKHYRTIRVAVAHKLLRQAFGVAKSGSHFQHDY